MFPYYRKFARTVFDMFLIGLTVLLVVKLFTWTYVIAKPIIFSVFFFLCIEPMAQWIHKKGMKKSIASLLSLLTILLVIAGILYLLIAFLIQETQQFVIALPSYETEIQSKLFYFNHFLTQRINRLPKGTAQQLKTYETNASTKLTHQLSQILSGIYGNVSSSVRWAGSLVVGLIMGFLLSVSREKMTESAKNILPNSLIRGIRFAKTSVGKGIIQYLKAQGILMLISFVILLIGFWVIGLRSALLFSSLATVTTLIPIVGSALVLVPLLIYLLIIGKFYLALSVCIVLALFLLFRHYIEPKVLGDLLGVPAYVMLALLLIAAHFWGLKGMFLTPFFVLFYQSLRHAGYLKRWIHIPKDEYDD